MHWQTLLIDFENNYYSGSSLYAIIIQIVIMLLDRFCYIKVVSFLPPSFQGLLFLKILLQFLFNVFICFFLMVGLPYYTNTMFGRNPAAIVFFYIQLGYIVASAAQIREGYPNADSYIASMIDNSYSIFNRIIFFVRFSFSQ